MPHTRARIVRLRSAAMLGVALALLPLSAAHANPPGAPAADAAPAAEHDLNTPEGVYAYLHDPDAARATTAPEREAMLAVVESASNSAPKDARWLVARAALKGRLGAKEEAAELAERAVKLAPESAHAQARYGTALFENIDNVGMFSKKGVASDAEKAYLKAVELDPAYLEPRFGLIQFYANAPGIAGGSLKKARQQAEAMIKVGGRAVSPGHSMLAMIAAKDENWDEAAKQHRLAAESAAAPRDKFSALVSLGLMLARDKGDPRAALKVADEARALGVPDDSGADFVTGLARQKLGEWDAAIASYREVLRKNTSAVNSRFALAECLEQTGDKAGAASMYEEFAAMFPNEKRAEDAASRAKKLRKAMKK